MARHDLTSGAQQPIEEVHLIFKTHLDIGFTDFARNVVERYMTRFIPGALAVARTLREAGGVERFVWTTGSWLIAEYLERASPDERRAMEQAIAAGDIAWHGLPFTTHTELMDPELFRYGLSIAQDLDRRFDRQTIAAKMTDVPGHTRGAVPLMAQAGLRFLHIGVNQASTPPDVPPIFVWRSPGGAEIVVMYHRGSYGGVMAVPGLSAAIAIAHTGDNQGPQTPEAVRAMFEQLRAQFPGARVIASTLDAFAERLLAIKAQLPVVTQELGDTWIHGAATDPQKLSQFRELLRLRREWLAAGRVQPGDRRLAGFHRALLLVAEHTWGLDVKLHLADYQNYAAEQFRAASSQPNFKKLEASWAEQRGYLEQALEALEPPLAEQARQRLAALSPAAPARQGYRPLQNSGTPTETPYFEIGFDRQHGAITHLRERASGRLWASQDHPLALFRYQTFSHQDYQRFRRQYNINQRATSEWAVPDFTKPGMQTAGAQSRFRQPQLVSLSSRHEQQAVRFLLELAMDEDSVRAYGAPRRLTLEVCLPTQSPTLELTLQWFDKPACRLPEALWLSFVPLVADPRCWRMDKLGDRISPLEVVRDGNRHLHAVGEGLTYTGPDGQLAVEPLDAPLVAPGAPALLNFTNRQPALKQGLHFNLYNNIWGTNFPMWSAEDARLRFLLRLGPFEKDGSVGS